MKLELVKIVPVQNTLGESVIWDHRLACLWWTDIHEKKLYNLDWKSQNITIFPTPERLTAIGLTENPGVLICAFENGFAYFSPALNMIKWVHKLGAEKTTHIRLNDGRLDRQGRFWAGSMVEHPNRENLQERGKLYCLDRKGQVSVHKEDILISNSLSWSPDGQIMYFADTPKRQIMRMNFDSTLGHLSAPEIFSRTENGPDGSTVDQEGNLWNAEWGNGTIMQYAPSGDVIGFDKLPVSQVACCCFAGPDMDYLCVSTARENLSDDIIAKEPHAGDLFIFKTTSQGLHDTLFPDIRNVL